MAPGITSSTDPTFTANVLRSDLPVLVDFCGEWCGPCMAMLPMLEQFAQNSLPKLCQFSHPS